MNSRRGALLLSLALLLPSCGGGEGSLSSSSSGSEPPAPAGDALAFENAGFEYGNLAGWVAQGNSFPATAIQTDSPGDRTLRHIEGDFYLDGFVANGDGATGTLLSPLFEVTSPRLTLLLGGGKDPSLCYVEILDEEGNSLLKKGNDLFYSPMPTDRLYRQAIDLSAHAGEMVRLRIVDADAGRDGWNHLLVDDIRLGEELPLMDGTPIGDANLFQEAMKGTVPDLYRHKYHLMPSYGWMNDPNGFLFDGEKFHLFYQANPYAATWGNMSWGHQTSKDLIHWEDEGIAITPDSSYDRNGCFSGGAAMVGSTMRLLYTSVGEGNRQEQAVATSYDGGRTFAKTSRNPVITSGMSYGSRVTDFRDPYVFEKDGKYYALVGGKLEGTGSQILLYESEDFLDWKGVGVALSSPFTGNGMFECPNVAFFGEKAAIIASPQGVRDQDPMSYQNVHSVAYEVGTLDLGTGKFQRDSSEERWEELDKGFDFYATQVVQHEGRNILLAWMNHWSRGMPTSAYGWCGEATLPRELELRDGILYQHPISEIYGYFGEATLVEDLVLDDASQDLGTPGNCLSFKARIDVSELPSHGRAGFRLFEGEGERTFLYYDKALGALVMDRRESGLHISEADGDAPEGIRYCPVEPDEEGVIELECFLDVSSLEVFVNGGRYTMTGLVYPKETSEGISFYSEGGKSTLLEYEKSDILV